MAARLARLVLGEKQTPQLAEDLQRAVTAVAHAREQLAQHARKVLGLPPALLFGHEPANAAAAGNGHPSLTDGDQQDALGP